MAPKFLSRLTIVTIILSLSCAANSAQVRAASPSILGRTSPTFLTSTFVQPLFHRVGSVSENRNLEPSEIKQQVFKFYFSPALVPNMDFAKMVLPKYVEDMNTILAKNTNRQLVFNPETDILLVNTQPHTDQAQLPLPVESFEIWAYAVQCNCSISYGGYAGVDESGAGVLAGMKWTKLYDPDTVTSTELSDYWTQINNMLHEFAHIFGAGIGEYYRLSNIQDTTGVAPSFDINILSPDDIYWSDKPDFMADPLLQNAAQSESHSNRDALLGFVKYSNLTATVISGNYRNELPTVDLQNITVSAVTDKGTPLNDANIKIWSVIGIPPYQTQLMVDAFTDSNGQISFAWGGSADPHNDYDFLRLIKVYKDGYIASAKYISIFDADIIKLIGGSNSFNIAIALNPAGPLPAITSIVRASANPTSATIVAFTVTFSEAVTGVFMEDFILATQGGSGAAVIGVKGDGSIYSVTVNTGTDTKTLRLDVVEKNMIVDSASNPLRLSNGNYTGGETYMMGNIHQIYLPLAFMD